MFFSMGILVKYIFRHFEPHSAKNTYEASRWLWWISYEYTHIGQHLIKTKKMQYVGPIFHEELNRHIDQNLLYLKRTQICIHLSPINPPPHRRMLYQLCWCPHYRRHQLLSMSVLYCCNWGRCIYCTSRYKTVQASCSYMSHFCNHLVYTHMIPCSAKCRVQRRCLSLQVLELHPEIASPILLEVKSYPSILGLLDRCGRNVVLLQHSLEVNFPAEMLNSANYDRLPACMQCDGSHQEIQNY